MLLFRATTSGVTALLTLAAATGAAHAATGIPAGTTALVDRPAGGTALPLDQGTQAGADGLSPISADGNLVVFRAGTDGFTNPDPASRVSSVYVRNQAAHTTTNVCRASGAAGALANGNCGFASISPNGRMSSLPRTRRTLTRPTRTRKPPHTPAT